MEEKKTNKIFCTIIIAAAVLLFLFNAVSFFGASIFLPGKELAKVIGSDPQTNHRTQLDLSKGKVILHVWATWCGSCLAEMPEINKIAAKHRLYGVIKPVFKYEIYREVAPEFKNVIAPDEFFKDLYLSVLPTTLFIENGVIKEVHTGPVTAELAEQWFRSL